MHVQPGPVLFRKRKRFRHREGDRTCRGPRFPVRLQFARLELGAYRGMTAWKTLDVSLAELEMGGEK